MRKRWIDLEGLARRHKRIRKKISGTKELPRVSVYRSIKNMYVQLIDDADGKTLLSVSTSSPSLKEKLKKDTGNVKGASVLGAALADECKKKGIEKVVFDRSGYLYHGRVKALAEAARKGGLKF
jgi:large subunit ribosomal protein L18